MRSTASLLMVALTAFAQTPTPDGEVRVSSRPYAPSSLVVRVESNLVQVGVVVRDPKGRAISGLKREDFRVLDQGKEREISSFAVDELSERATALATLEPGAPAVAAAPTAVPAQARRPRFIALFFDDFGTPSGDIMRTKVAGKRFVEDGLSPGDQVAVFTTSGGRLTEYTADKTKTIAAIDHINAHPRFSENGMAVCPRITPYEAYLIANGMNSILVQLKVTELVQCSNTPSSCGTSAMRPGLGGAIPQNMCRNERDQVIAQAEQTWGLVKMAAQNTLEDLRAAIADLSRQRGSRVMLLVSSGFLAGTLWQERDRLVDDALRAGVVINSLDAKGVFVEAPGRPPTADVQAGPVLPAAVFAWETMSAVDAKEVPSDILGDLAAATGGLFFHHNNDYSFGFRELGSIPNVTYQLGFRPGEDADGKYHNLKVRLTSNSGHSGYLVEARPGYLAAKSSAPPAGPTETPRGRLDAEVNGAASANDFPLKVHVDLGADLPNGVTRLDVQFHVDAARLPFPQKDDRHMQRLTLVAALFDASGKMVTAKEGIMELALKDTLFERFQHDGVNLSLTLGAPAGAYRLRAVVQEGVDHKISSASAEVQVP